MRKFLYKSAVIFNILFAFLLLLSYLSVHVNPERVPVLGIFGLGFPVFILVNIFFLILFIYKKKRVFLISLLVLCLGFFRIINFFAFNISSSNTVSNDPLKIMSYNVRLFDLYKWSDVDNAGDKILNLIKNEDADIICLQEFFSNADNNYQDKIIDMQSTKAYIISGKGRTGYSGNAIFSKYPIINKGFVDIQTLNQKCIYADISKNNDTIRIYSIHLASIHLNSNDYTFFKNIKNNDQTKNIEGFKGIGSKLMQAYKKRSKEVDIISPHIEKSPYKTIVCGDFNDTPISYSYQKIKGKLKDSFLESCFGIGNTYSKSLPLFRIDYIFYSPEMSSSSYKKIKEEYSDHFAITALIE